MDFAIGAIILVVIIAIPFWIISIIVKAFKDAASSPKGRRKNYGSEEWHDIPIEHRKPDGWVFLPRSPKGKLVTISTEDDQKWGREVLLKAAKRGKEYTLTAEREPTNPYDSRAVAVYVETPTQPKIQAGYIPKDASVVLASDYRDDMPISAMLYEARTNGTYDYLCVRILVPSAKKRAKFEL